MAQSSIHPEMHPLQVRLSDDDVFSTFSASNIGSIEPEVSLLTHPAWNPDKKNRASAGEKARSVVKFHDRYGAFASMSSRPPRSDSDSHAGE